MASTSGGSAVLVVEGGTGGHPETPRRALLSASVTLTLAILGSTVLPVPFAFSRLGVLPGLLLMLGVALANALAGTLLLRCAGSLDKHSFEGLAEAVGGQSWKLVTQISLILLLFGNLCADYCLLADMGALALQDLFPGPAAGLPPPPAWARWLMAGDGRGVMALLGAAVVFPLSCMRRMRELEQAATAGVFFVVFLAVVIVRQALAAGLPAITSGELPLLRPAVAGDLPEAVAVLSFAFYLTPLLLPLLREMPAGQLGVDLTCRATQLVTVVVAGITYAVIGLFAAARYGLRTEGDVLVNAWLPGRWDGVLDALMTLYLGISMAPMAITLRHQLDNLLVGEDAVLPRSRQVAVTAGCLASSLLVSLGFPTQAERMFAITGATAVCAVCYIMPFAIHLKLYLRSSYGASKRGRRHISSGSRAGGIGGGRGGKAGIAGGSSGSGSYSCLGRRQCSFSFDRQQAAAVARAAAAAAGSAASHVLATSSGGASGDDNSSGPDMRWLLRHDHHAGSASGGAAAAAAAAHRTQHTSLAAALAAQQQREQGEGWASAAAAGGEEDEEGGPAAATAAALLRGHRWTDLSLNRWLQGQSFDSLGMGESAPATPVSPGGGSTTWYQQGGRSSLDSFRDGFRGDDASLPAAAAAAAAGTAAGMAVAAAADADSGEQQVEGRDDAAVAAADAGDLQYHQSQYHQSQQEHRTYAVAAAAQDDAGWAFPSLQAVPETEPQHGSGGGSAWGGFAYPCLADANGALLPLLWHLVLPVVVMVAGVGFSISALWLAVAALLD